MEELCAFEGVDESGKYDFTQDFKKLLSVVKLHNKMVGLGSCINILLGEKDKKGKTCHFASSTYFGSGKDKSKNWWKEIGK